MKLSRIGLENHATSKLSNVDLNNHQCKHRRRFRFDREPSRILIQSLKCLGNKSRKVRECVYAHVLSCIPMPSSVYCYVNVSKQQNETTFLLNCCGRIRQSIKRSNMELIDIF